MLDATDKIYKLISEALEDIGYEIVKIKFLKIDDEETLQIMIDHIDQSKNILFKDCENATHKILSITEAKEIIEEKYNLEISSPGIDRPLVRIKDFIRFKNFDAKFIVSEEIFGIKKFKAEIIEVNDNKIKLLMKNDLKEVTINFEIIKSASLIINDKLLKAFRNINEKQDMNHG